MASGYDKEQRRRQFESVVDAYYARIYHLFCHLVSDTHLAADLTQDTFVKAYEAFGRFRGEASVYTWLYRIAINEYRSYLRRLRREQEFISHSLDEPVEVEGENLFAQVPDPSPSALQLLEKAELIQRIQQAVQSLPPRYRAFAVLRDLEGMSYEQIAEVTGLPLDTVKTRIARARAMLRRKLESYYRG
ncbi:MAG: sigma-70 family RNA polymerase sigma factor [Armatimonadota bacterium]|nr:sigma-70 family RNA polymerase sigma factor [bacterium]MCS7309189.1 sigma-70 family RNA polymerase sigma factor [Armatimonadota bacterium]MDW8103382.1 sigma-70 family RNA polymerase sigma factor [Armatimonadota bacterium]MDW8289244.1 sigma-70 family RNA polymerase sigma factor [Armatimonadota bacterium]